MPELFEELERVNRLAALDRRELFEQEALLLGGDRDACIVPDLQPHAAPFFERRSVDLDAAVDDPPDGLLHDFSRA